MTAYYNEFNKEAAAWIRELIKMGLIAAGEVDERSIIDVQPEDLRGFTQHHFFAGVGGWSYALRQAGWSDDKPICSASLPCQPFSCAGKQLGKADERHLLPHFIELVKECGFSTIIGEQVPGAIKQGWLDDLYDEMEREGYTCGSHVLTAAGAGSPHIRQRIYWMAYADGLRQSRQCRGGSEKERVTECSETNGMGDPEHNGHTAGSLSGSNGETIQNCETWSNSACELEGTGSSGVISAESIDWLYCRDEKYRPIKSGIKPLVDGFPRGVVHSINSSISPNETGEARVMRLKGYGNAIQIDTATAFIKAAMYAMEANR